MEPALSLEDLGGKPLAQTVSGLLGHTGGEGGTFILSIRDREYRGGKEFGYRLRVGAIPIVTSFMPLGVQRGAVQSVYVGGVFLDGIKHIEVRASADAALGSRIPVPVKSKLGPVLNPPSLVVGEFPEVNHLKTISVPGTGSSEVGRPGDMILWELRAKKGQPLII